MQHRILSVATRCATEPCSAAPPRRGTGPLNQAATPKRRPIERHAQQYGRRPLSRAAAWQCVARASQAASVEPLEEPVRAVDGSRSPRRRPPAPLSHFGRPGLPSAPRDRLRTSEHADVDQLYELVSHATVKEGAQEDARRRHVAERGCGRGFRRPLEAPGGSGGAKKWPGRLALPVWWGRVGSGINPGFFKVIHCTPDRELDGCVLRVFAHDQSHQFHDNSRSHPACRDVDI